jgi:hypothetical protein
MSHQPTRRRDDLVVHVAQTSSPGSPRHANGSLDPNAIILPWDEQFSGDESWDGSLSRNQNKKKKASLLKMSKRKELQSRNKGELMAGSGSLQSTSAGTQTPDLESDVGGVSSFVPSADLAQSKPMAGVKKTNLKQQLRVNFRREVTSGSAFLFIPAFPCSELFDGVEYRNSHFFLSEGSISGFFQNFPHQLT